MTFVAQNNVNILIQNLIYFCELIDIQLIVYFIISITTILILLNVMVTELHSDFIHFSGPSKKLGEKIVTALGIGAAAAGSYQGVKEVTKDIKSVINSGGSDSNSSGSNNYGNGSNQGNNNNGKK